MTSEVFTGCRSGENTWRTIYPLQSTEPRRTQHLRFSSDRGPRQQIQHLIGASLKLVRERKNTNLPLALMVMLQEQGNSVKALTIHSAFFYRIQYRIEDTFE
jgi:hypothetical protein